MGPQRGLVEAVGLWMNGDPKTCQGPGFAGYCARLLDRWYALWQRRQALGYNPLSITPTPTPWPTATPSLTPSETPTPTTQP